MRDGRCFAIGLLVATLLLAACEDKPAAPKPLSEAQKASVLKAVDQAREAFNAGDCLVHFPPSSGTEWTDQCQDLRARLGDWRSFNLTACARPNEEYACLSGPGEFANGSAEVLLHVGLQGGRAYVSRLSVDRDRNHWSFPPALRPWQQFQDPPMRPPEGRREG